MHWPFRCGKMCISPFLQMYSTSTVRHRKCQTAASKFYFEVSFCVVLPSQLLTFLPFLPFWFWLSFWQYIFLCSPLPVWAVQSLTPFVACSRSVVVRRRWLFAFFTPSPWENPPALLSSRRLQWFKKGVAV